MRELVERLNRKRLTGMAGFIAAGFVLLASAAILVAAPVVSGNADEPLIADLDNHLVAITTDFTGSEVLLFGSAADEGEVVVVVHGPKNDVTVRKKNSIAGIWMNTDNIVFHRVPAFYHVATTSNAIPTLPQTALKRHQIGVKNIRLSAADERSREEIETFRDALVRIKQREGNYTITPGRVDRRGGRLFRTTVYFPANVPVGTYTVETLLVRDGEVTSAQTTPLFISKVGVGARVFRMAHEQSLLFGIAAVILAILAGLAANYAFRRS